jgi:dihydrodipicolinate synthase/N-acetylneuraminate lyase
MEISFSVTGVIPPLLTPFADSGTRVDEGALRAHAHWLVDKGVHGLMPCGTTGEGPLLTVPERKRVVEVVVEAVAHEVPVLAHVGAPTTRETIDLAQHARACEVEAISVVTPYYYRLPDDALIEHFCRVADSVADTPVFLYNIPHCTGNTLSLPAVQTITACCPNVIGIKDSSGRLDALSVFVGLNNGRFQVVCGSDALLLRALEAGACASVSGNANVFPEIVIGPFRAVRRHDRRGARQQQELLDQVGNLLGNGQNLSLFKRVLALRGPGGGSVRPPLPEATADMIACAEEGLRSLRLL